MKACVGQFVKQIWLLSFMNCDNLPPGSRHSAVDSSVPSILPPQVQVPSMPFTLLTIKVKFVLYLFLHCEKNKNKQKEPRFCPLTSSSPYTKEFLLAYSPSKVAHLRMQITK